MISFNRVSVQRNDTMLIKDVTFTVETGEKAVIYGKSGSGKSTILLTLVGARTPSAGTIFFDGKNVSAENIGTIRRSVAFVLQEPVLGAPTVRESLLLPFTFAANKEDKPSLDTMKTVLERLHLPENILDKSSSVLSGGEKQRIAIARSLLLQKQVYVLDEVTSALDSESKKALLDLFANSRFTIISVSHDPDWFSICNKAIHINDGTVDHIGEKPLSDTKNP
ncbi:MAG: ATP-binding cassette domain-containing protein [Chitinispirillaceae bacterium]